MTKIFFPYNDQPKKFSFKFPEPIRFPFYVNDLVYWWEADSHGITMYLISDNISPDTPVLKDIMLEETGISMYLVNNVAGTSKHILIEFAKIGWGMDTLGLLDPFTLGEIDPFTLGDISICYANWMNLSNSVVKVGIDPLVKASDVKMQLDSGAVIPFSKDIYTGELHGGIGLVGLNGMRHLTLGELDPHTIGDIDAMLSTFRVFGSIPASLVKEIRITQKNALHNNDLAPQISFGMNASGIEYFITTSKSVESISNITLGLSEHHIGISSGTMPLEIDSTIVEE